MVGSLAVHNEYKTSLDRPRIRPNRVGYSEDGVFLRRRHRQENIIGDNADFFTFWYNSMLEVGFYRFSLSIIMFRDVYMNIMLSMES